MLEVIKVGVEAVMGISEIDNDEDSCGAGSELTGGEGDRVVVGEWAGEESFRGRGAGALDMVAGKVIGVEIKSGSFVFAGEK